MDKNYILDEIDRTAKESNGKPLGKDRFAAETGIKPSDWGKHWAKWNEAVIQAGYLPNKMQSAYDEKFIIEQVISFIQDIGNFPTDSEFSLKSYNTKGFPSRDTIHRRLGKKPEMVRRIIEYCEGNSEYFDVIEICKEVSDALQHELEYYPEEIDSKYGYVYLMKSGRYYKIGRSSHPERRSYDIGIKLPEPLKIIHKIKTDDPTGIENYWHNRFQDKRKEGEWFALSNSDVKAFKRMKFA